MSYKGLSVVKTLAGVLLSGFLFSFLVTSLCADFPEEAFFQDIPSVVTPARMPQRPWHAPSTVKVVTAEKIKKWGVRSVADILRRIGGVDVRKYGRGHHIGPRGTATTQYIINVLILINGVPANDPLFGDFDLGPDVPVEMIKQVEVVSGPGSSLYGANAFAGVINLVTKKGSDIPQPEIRTEIGPDGFHEGTLLYSNQTMKRSWMFGARGEFTDGRDRHAVNDNDEFRDRDLWFTVTDEKAEFFGYTSNLDQGRPGNTLDSDLDDHIGTSNQYLRGTYKIKEKSNESLICNVYNNEKDGYFQSGDPASAKVPYDTNRLGINVQGTRENMKNGTLVAGVEWAGKKADWRDIGGSVSSHESAFYVQQEVRTHNDWTLTIGGRLDHDSIFGSNFSPRFSALRRLGHQRTLRFSAGQAYRAPNFSEQYINADIGTAQVGPFVLPLRSQGNQDLEPELMSTIEAAFSHNVSSSLRYDVNLFYNKTKDRIDRQISVPGAFVLAVPVNQGRSVARGVELDIRKDFTEKLTTGFNYTFQRVYDKDTDETLLYAPKHQINFNLEIDLPRRWSAYWLTHYVSSRNGDFQDNLPSFVTHDLRISRAVTDNVSFAINVYNLADKEYAESDSYPMPERTTTFEMTVKF